MSSPTTASQTIESVIAAEVPRFMRRRYIAWIIAAIGVVIILVLLSLILDQSEDNVEIAVVVFSFALIYGLMWVLSKWLRRSASRAFMPAIAQAAGFTYRPDYPNVGDLERLGLIPRAWVSRAEDYLEGQLANRVLTCGDILVRENDDRQFDEIFQGLVITLSTGRSETTRLLARKGLTEGFLFSRGKVDIRDLGTVSFDDPSYELHTAAGDDPEQAVRWAAALTRLDREVPGASLYAVMRTEEMTIVMLSHSRDAFAIGGLLVSADDLHRQMDQAARELLMPLTVGQIILDAEAVSAVMS